MYVVAAEYYTQGRQGKGNHRHPEEDDPALPRGTGLQAVHGEPVAGGSAQAASLRAVRQRGRIQGPPGNRRIQGEHPRQGRADAREPRSEFLRGRRTVIINQNCGAQLFSCATCALLALLVIASAASRAASSADSPPPAAPARGQKPPPPLGPNGTRDPFPESDSRRRRGHQGELRRVRHASRGQGTARATDADVLRAGHEAHVRQRHARRAVFGELGRENGDAVPRPRCRAVGSARAVPELRARIPELRVSSTVQSAWRARLRKDLRLRRHQQSGAEARLGAARRKDDAPCGASRVDGEESRCRFLRRRCAARADAMGTSVREPQRRTAWLQSVGTAGQRRLRSAVPRECGWRQPAAIR